MTKKEIYPKHEAPNSHCLFQTGQLRLVTCGLGRGKGLSDLLMRVDAVQRDHVLSEQRFHRHPARRMLRPVDRSLPPAATQGSSLGFGYRIESVSPVTTEVHFQFLHRRRSLGCIQSTDRLSIHQTKEGHRLPTLFQHLRRRQGQHSAVRLAHHVIGISRLS